MLTTLDKSVALFCKYECVVYTSRQVRVSVLPKMTETNCEIDLLTMVTLWPLI